jgi:hypothetical protein
MCELDAERAAKKVESECETGAEEARLRQHPRFTVRGPMVVEEQS